VLAALRHVLTQALYVLLPLIIFYCGWHARGVWDRAQVAETATDQLAELKGAQDALLEATRTATEQSAATLRNARATSQQIQPILEAAGLGVDRCPVPPEQLQQSVEARRAYNAATGAATQDAEVRR
jgi:DNA-binding protein H-NS